MFVRRFIHMNLICSKFKINLTLNKLKLNNAFLLQVCISKSFYLYEFIVFIEL